MKESFNIPRIFKNDKFTVLQKGVFDSDSMDVYINEQRDFAFLYPYNKMDYSDYQPREKSLNLLKYKDKTKVYKGRYDKIRHILAAPGISTVLEVGASDAGFLKIVKEAYPSLKLGSVEIDDNTVSERKKIVDEDYKELSDVNKKYDVVCLFHVFEHIVEPVPFLDQLKKVMHDSSVLIIEVPSLNDPLISTYKNSACSMFYFQKQHPYVYSNDSLKRIMEHSGFKTIEIISYQRYGLENHLNWIIKGEPGGNTVFREIFSVSDDYYKKDLERAGKTDTVFYVGRK